ncbi:MAG TPA: cytochrome c3 family protein [Gemmatimonadota bacterium]|nr:cytochrome c3 family protein [Gemmatimonadota bacterium]
MRAAANGFRAAILSAACLIATSACGDVRSAPTQNKAPEQPIAFMHTVHAGDNRIPCAYCHFSTNVSEEAGIPAVGTCMGCHRFVQGTSPEFQREIQKLMQFWADSTSIPWQRVYTVPEFVQFTHQPHIRAGVTCATCHGDVAAMVRVEKVTPLTMGWCVNCHRDRGAPDDCAACHY